MAVRLTNDATTTGGDDAIFAANFD
jgi:hypothetical protein